MKTSKFMKSLVLSAITGVCLAGSAHAQGHVGGGDPSELSEFTGLNGERLESWHTVKQDLISGILMGKTSKLNLGALNLSAFNEKALSALRSTKVEFDHQRIQVEGTDRPCENYHDEAGIKRIHCNVEDYQSAMANFHPETQYKFVAHEYFGAAGLEPNAYGVSDYPFSAQISSQLSQVQVKRWAVLPEVENSRCSGKAVSAIRDYAEIFCHGSCQVLPGSVKVISATNGKQDEATKYVIEIETKITGPQQSMHSKLMYQLSVGYSKPPSHFSISAQCEVWGDIVELE